MFFREMEFNCKFITIKDIILVHIIASIYYRYNTKNLGTPYLNSLTKYQKNIIKSYKIIYKQKMMKSMIAGIIVAIIVYFMEPVSKKNYLNKTLTREQKKIKNKSVMVRAYIFKEGMMRGIILSIIVKMMNCK